MDFAGWRELLKPALHVDHVKNYSQRRSHDDSQEDGQQNKPGVSPCAGVCGVSAIVPRV